MEVFPSIYEVFRKLINLYAARFDYEDGVAELNLHLIEVLYSLDLSRFESDESFGIQKYIAVALRNRYMSLSIKKSQRDKNSMPLFDNVAVEKENRDDLIALWQVFSRLNEKQKEILVYKYIYGYSDAELSRVYGVSRQSVNGMKIRALATLRRYMER